MEPALHLTTYLEKYHYKYLALYYALREAILEGRLSAGSKLPSTRELADRYDLSRGCVAQSYDMLLAEGYVEAQVGRGTFVSQAGSIVENLEPVDSPIQLSNWGRRLAALPTFSWKEHSGPEDISFLSESMSMSYFPYSEWRSALAFAGGKGGIDLQQEVPPQGDLLLRQAIAAHLRLTRGILADPEHIVLFSGSMQGIMLLFQLLMNEGETAVVENPCFNGIRRALAAIGGQPLAANVDHHGIQPQNWDSRMLFVTPSRQYPTGAILSLERRRQLLEWAQRRDAVIIEDDYDSEFRWGGRPIEPLKTLDTQERVIYLGSFSKTMFAGLRLGYALLPAGLVDPVIRAKAIYDPMSPGLLEQRALARFMAKGDYGKHLRRMTRMYGARHRHFCTLMREFVSEIFTLMPGDSGLHVYAYWQRSPEEYAAFIEAAKRSNVIFRDAAVFHVEQGPLAACFGFAHLDEQQLTEGVKRLAAAWQDVQNNV